MSHFENKPMESYNRLDEHTNPGAVVVGMEPQYPNRSTQVLHMQETSKPFAYDALILNVITYLCCCPLLGFFGILAALMSYTDHRTNDYVSHKSKRNIALGCGIAGIVIGVLAIIVVIAIVVTTINKAEEFAVNISNAAGNNDYIHN